MSDTGLTRSPKFEKGALVQLVKGLTGVIPNVIPFQYNPEKLSHTPMPWNPFEVDQTQRGAQAPTAQPFDPKESFNPTLEIDATKEGTMAFALKSKSQGKTQGAEKSASKQKSARGQLSADTRSGYEMPVFQPLTAAPPIAPVIQAKLKTGEPTPPSQNRILQRKCACGGATGTSGGCEACGKKRPPGLQTDLKINEPGDVYEQEADRIANQVMAAPAHTGVSAAPLHIQRFSEQSKGLAGAAPASVDKALASPGRLLEPALRQDMERRFGYDFSRVRAHTGAAAEKSAQEVNANAYTVGHDIVFGAGRFAPGTRDGRRLIAHELTHVVQQSGHNMPYVQRDNKGDEQQDQQAKANINALPKHIRDFLTKDKWFETVKGDSSQRLARAGRILKEYGVKPDELELERQRRIDKQELGIPPKNEEADPETWAQNYVGSHKRTRADEVFNARNLLGAAENLSFTSPEVIKAGPLLDIFAAKSKLSSLAARNAISKDLMSKDPNWEQYSPIQRIEKADNILSGLAQTLQRFERALVADLKTLATIFLDDTEVRLIKMRNKYVGSLYGTSYGPGFLESVIDKLKKNPVVIKVLKEHEENKKSIDQQALDAFEKSGSADPIKMVSIIDKRKSKLKEEEKRYNNALRRVVAENSDLNFPQGFDVDEILFAEGGHAAQLELNAKYVEGRRNIREAREKLDKPKFLYSADKVIEEEKKRIGEAFEIKSLCDVSFEAGTLEQLGCKALESNRLNTVNLVIDKLAEERKSEKSTWEELWKLFEFVANFVPGPIGWGARFVATAVNFNAKIGTAADQRRLYISGLSARAADPNAGLSALIEAAIQTLPDAALTLRSVERARPLTLGAKDLAGSVADEAAILEQRSAANLRERGGSQAPPKPIAPKEPPKTIAPKEPPKPAAPEVIPHTKPVSEMLELGRIQQPVTLAGQQHKLYIKRVGNRLEIWLCSNHCGDLIERCERLLPSVTDPIARAEVIAVRRRAELLQNELNSGKLTAELMENELAGLRSRLEQVNSKEPRVVAEVMGETIVERQGMIPPGKQIQEPNVQDVSAIRGAPPLESGIKGEIGEVTHAGEVSARMPVRADKRFSPEELLKERDALLRGDITLREFAENYPPEGVAQIFFPTVRGSGRVIDHVYVEASTMFVVFRESKNYRLFKLGAKELRQLKKDLDFLTHPRFKGLRIEWRISGKVPPETISTLDDLVTTWKGRFSYVLD